MDKITLDREVFKALASDTRLDILKALDVRQKTVTELAKELGLNKATVFEHLEKLAAVDLIQKLEDERKWVYWQLTWKGRRLLHPEKITLALLLSSAMGTLLTAVAAAWMWVRSGVAPAFGTDERAADALAPDAAYKGAEENGSAEGAGAYSASDAPPSMALRVEEPAADAAQASAAADPVYLAVAVVMALVFLALVGYAVWYWRKRRDETASGAGAA